MAARKPVDVYLEVGRTRVIATALDWPGWCRMGRDEASALAALAEYAPRYSRALKHAAAVAPPGDVVHLRVVERLAGDKNTDWGAPSQAPSADKRALKPDALARLVAVLEAAWDAFDAAAKRAAGKELRKGPRGGGRSVEQMVEHVLEADRTYLSRLGGAFPRPRGMDAWRAMRPMRTAATAAIEARRRGDRPANAERRRAALWTPREYIRRSAWHALDHAWEIEDRALP